MLEEELTTAKYAAREAGGAILRIAEQHYKTAVSGADRTVVTKADIEADRILQGHLRSGFPDYGWLSEETCDDATRLGKDRVWIVDPMDGTREFVMKIPEFVVSIALAEQGEPILAVIYNPTTGALYEAKRGSGTKCNGQALYCSRGLEGKPRIEVSRSDIQKNLFAGYEQYVELRPVGSIAYKLARLSSGKTDATVSITPKNEWDIAAGVLLVTEAGGKATDLDGRSHRFNEPNTLCNGLIAASRAAYDSVSHIVMNMSGKASY
ncbi:MAG: 3'(2'),5'-bisphosphate nucleotidase CysQ [Acidobacteria bacterium]|nr:3'(2'),5'-bisphosphate nucleotidase CysQ [Acidobacteriota bacterium]